MNESGEVANEVETEQIVHDASYTNHRYVGDDIKECFFLCFIKSYPTNIGWIVNILTECF